MATNSSNFRMPSLSGGQTPQQGLSGGLRGAEDQDFIVDPSFKAPTTGGKGLSGISGGENTASVGIGAGAQVAGGLISGFSQGAETRRNEEASDEFDPEFKREERLNRHFTDQQQGEDAKFQTQLDNLAHNRTMMIQGHNNFLNKFEEEFQKGEQAKIASDQVFEKASSNEQYQDMLFNMRSL